MPRDGRGGETKQETGKAAHGPYAAIVPRGLSRPETQHALGRYVPELHRVGTALVVVVPLVAIMPREHLAGLARRHVQERTIPVAQVGRHPSGGSQPRGGLLDGGGESAHRFAGPISKYGPITGTWCVTGGRCGSAALRPYCHRLAGLGTPKSRRRPSSMASARAGQQPSRHNHGTILWAAPEKPSTTPRAHLGVVEPGPFQARPAPPPRFGRVLVRQGRHNGAARSFSIWPFHPLEQDDHGVEAREMTHCGVVCGRTSSPARKWSKLE